MEAIDKLRQRLKSYSLTYERRFETWCKLLEEIKHLEPELQADLYDEFVEECPFTYSQWNAYAQMWANTGNNEKAYEVQEIFELVANKRALAGIGLDYNSGGIWDMYLAYEEQQKDFERQNNIYWALVSLPLKDLNSFELRFKSFIDKIDDEELLLKFLKTVGRSMLDSLNLVDPTVDYVRNTLKGLYSSYLLQSSAQADQRAKFESAVDCSEYKGEAYSNENKVSWLNLIKYEKKSSLGHERIVFTIERAITYMSTCPEMWEQLVQYLENVKEDREYLLQTLSKYKTVLIFINQQLVFLLSDLCELEGDLLTAREVFNDLNTLKPDNIEILQKNAEFELRHGNSEAAVQIYERVIFQSELKPKSKIYAVGKLITIYQKSEIHQTHNPNFSSFSAVQGLLVRAQIVLPYDRILLSFVVQNIRKISDQKTRMLETVIVFEKAMAKAKQISNEEFSFVLGLYTKTVRDLSDNIDDIFMVEKNLSKRYGVSEDEFERQWYAYSNQLIQEFGGTANQIAPQDDKLELENFINSKIESGGDYDQLNHLSEEMIGKKHSADDLSEEDIDSTSKKLKTTQVTDNQYNQKS